MSSKLEVDATQEARGHRPKNRPRFSDPVSEKPSFLERTATPVSLFFCTGLGFWLGYLLR